MIVLKKYKKSAYQLENCWQKYRKTVMLKKRLAAIIILISATAINGISQKTVGLFTNTADAYNGYTLFAPLNYNTTYLIDNCGEIINTWQSQHRPGLSAYLLEDGSLLRTASIPNGTFSNGGGLIERYDWDGNLTWTFEVSDSVQYQHHDIAYLPNGNILVLAWEYKSTTEAVAIGRDPALVVDGLWGEKVMELQPVGSDSAVVVWEWRLYDHVVQDIDSTKPNYGMVAQHPELINLNYVYNTSPNSLKDWIHANSIDYHPQLDQIIINSRNFDEFWVIDHSTTTTQAATHSGGNSGKGGDILYRWGNPQTYDRGTAADKKLFSQHDAQWIGQGLYESGKILVFNNGLARMDGSYSSVETIAPPIDANGNYSIDSINAYAPTTQDWIYTSTPHFFSYFISGVQRLPNTNTLICEGDDGRFFEIDTMGNLVWEYINPVGFGGPVSQGNMPNNNAVFKISRYSPDYPAFIGKTLTPMGPVEINPFQSNCQLYVPTRKVNTLEKITLLGNPVDDILKIQNVNQLELSISLVDLTGKTLRNIQSDNFYIPIPVEELPRGIYILKIHSIKDNQQLTKKILKI